MSGTGNGRDNSNIPPASDVGETLWAATAIRPKFILKLFITYWLKLEYGTLKYHEHLLVPAGGFGPFYSLQLACFVLRLVIKRKTELYLQLLLLICDSLPELGKLKKCSWWGDKTSATYQFIWTSLQWEFSHQLLHTGGVEITIRSWCSRKY